MCSVKVCTHKRGDLLSMPSDGRLEIWTAIVLLFVQL